MNKSAKKALNYLVMTRKEVLIKKVQIWSKENYTMERSKHGIVNKEILDNQFMEIFNHCLLCYVSQMDEVHKI